MPGLWQVNVSFLEQGNIYFFYKPKKGIPLVRGLADVSRFYFVIAPYGGKRIRFIVMGPKRMPSVDDGREKAWGFVEKVGGRGFAVDNPEDSQPRIRGNARPAGEGLYAIVKHADHTHLVYVLELPQRSGDVQHALNIEREANYVLIVSHPRNTSTVVPDMEGRPKQTYDAELLERFGSRRYIPADPPGLMDYEGSMLYVIGVNDALSTLGVSVDKDRETEQTADIFAQLKVNKDRHPTEPLLKGKWK